MKAAWSGYLNLGNITIPVKLYSALQVAEPKFTLLHAKDLSPVKRTLKCAVEDKPLQISDTVKSIKYDSKIIVVTDSELSGAIELVRDITVKQFCETDAINPMYFDKPFYIVPDSGGEMVYTLVREALVKAKKFAIVSYALHTKEHIGAIMPWGSVLVLQQLRFAKEILPKLHITSPSLPQPDPNKVDIAIQLMNRYSAPFYIEDYTNNQSDALHELIDRKAKGLRPKRHARVAPHTTREEDVEPTLRALLAGNSMSLSDQ